MKNTNIKTTKKTGILSSKSMYCLFQSEKNILHQSGDVKQKQSNAISSIKKGNSSLKLRDYIFQLQINSKKYQQVRKKSPERTSPKFSPNSSLQYFKSNTSKSLIRSGKYEIDNKHIINVISQQAVKDLDNIISLASSIKREFELIKNEEIQQKNMAQIYNFRRSIKEKLLKEIIDLQDKVKKRGDDSDKNHKEQMDGLLALSMSIIDEETQPCQKDKKKNSQLSILQEQNQMNFQEI